MAKNLKPIVSERVAALKAKPDEMVRKQFVISAEKAVDDVARTARFKITTSGVDRDNDTVAAGGWDIANYMRSPVVLWAHDYSQLPLAKALDIAQTADGLESTAQFPPKGVHPFADTVFELVKGGYLNATSVGFRPLEYSRDDERGGINFQRQELLEFSIVPVPANPEALIVARSKGIDIRPLEQWARKMLLAKSSTLATQASAGKDALAALRKTVVSKDAATIAAAATTVDALIDALDTSYDALLLALGLPDEGETDSVMPDMPSSQSIPGGAGGDTSSGLPMRSARRRSGDPNIGETLTEPASVPAPGTATPGTMLCPACGSTYDGDICAACGWQAPSANPGTGDAHPMTAPVGGESGDRLVNASMTQRMNALSLKAVHYQPAYVSVNLAGDRLRTFNRTDHDPVRWNRQLSKTFDVAGEPLEPSRLEYAWASRYLEVPVQLISESTSFIPSARMGSFLAALDETVAGWKVDATRNMTDNGREVPPVFESMQLNSRQARSFLVEGLRFMRREDGAKIVGKLTPSWSGLYLTTYVRSEQAAVGEKFAKQTWERSAQLNYLKGEAFTLSGEFLDRGELNWPDIFLEPKQERVLRRIVERINDAGEHMESRGLMIMGPPGTGKTLGARVMMRQADTTFIWISARDFFRAGAYEAFTYAFDLAAECAPTILCFEDVDNYLHGAVIDLLKTEMDGMKRRKGIQTIMTTNFPELVPDALIDRPGRFDELMEVNLPSEAIRTRMLKAWLSDAPDASIAEAAKTTVGYSGAHIRELTKFARVIDAEEKVGVAVALTRALDKIKEQRELVASLRQAPDYRPRREVRAMVALAKEAFAKRGRVLSAANENRIQTARDGVSQAAEQLDTVLQQLKKPPTDQDDPDADLEETPENQSLALVLADDPLDVVVLELVGEEDALATADDMKRAVSEAFADIFGGLGPMVRAETQTALARARGRVD